LQIRVEGKQQNIPQCFEDIRESNEKQEVCFTACPAVVAVHVAAQVESSFTEENTTKMSVPVGSTKTRTERK
jgi:hypothetical protein